MLQTHLKLFLVTPRVRTLGFVLKIILWPEAPFYYTNTNTNAMAVSIMGAGECFVQLIGIHARVEQHVYVSLLSCLPFAFICLLRYCFYF